MAKENIIVRLQQQLRETAGFENDRIAADRITAWNYYFQRPRGDEIPGRSSVVSGDVSSMVEAVLSQMDDAFSTDNIVEFQANGPDDEDQARLESDTVIEHVMARNNGSLELLAGIKNCLLLRNGVCKVWVDDTSQTVNRVLTGVTSEALSEILAPQPGIETEVKDYDPETGVLDVDITTKSMELRVSSIPVANFHYPKDWHSLDVQQCPFIAERHTDTRAEMISQGFPASVVNRLPRMQSEFKQDLNAQAVGVIPQSSKQGVDDSQDVIEWFECYVLSKGPKNSIKRERICFSSNVELERKPVDLVPYAIGTVFINPNRLTGISLFDKLKQTQDTQTGLRRALFDNVNTVNKNRIAYMDGLVNVDDMSDGRINGTIRIRPGSVSDVRQAITAFTVPDISAGILANMQAERQTRAELGGAALTLATGEMQLSDRAGSQGIDRAYSVMEQLASHMTKVVAKTLIRSVFLLAHQTMRLNYNFPLYIKQGGKWIDSIPSNWPQRSNVFVKVGMSPGERSRRVNMLEKMLNFQISLADKGMEDVLVNVGGFYATMIDWARAGEIKNPERYVVDPDSPNAKKALQSKAQQASEQKQMQDKLVQQAVSLEQIRSAIAKYQTDVEAQFKYYDANLKAQIEEAKIVGAAVRDIVAIQEKPALSDEADEGEAEGESA